MARTLTDEDIDAVAERVITKIAARIGPPVTTTPPQPALPPPPAVTAQPAIPPGKLAFTKSEVLAELGISETTLWRLEARGLLRPVPGIRHKHYARTEVERFLKGENQPRR